MDTLELFTVKELSEYINIKPKTLYQWVGQQILPFYRIQGVIRFKKSEIDQWLTAQRQSGRACHTKG
jgi:excisionase family DNA binding protein